MNFDFGGVWGALRAMGQGFVARVPYIGVALLAFALFWLVGRSVNALTRRAVARLQGGRRQSVGLVLGRLAQGLILVVGAMVALVIAVPGFQPGDVVQVLGIGSVAVGFAFRDVLQNFLAGILLLLSEPFRIGDQIVVGAYEGTVEDIQARATFLRTYDGRRVVIPNSNLFTQTVTVNTAFERRRLEYEVRVAGDNEVEGARSAVLEGVRRAQTNLEDAAPDVLVVSLDGGNLFRARWWVRPSGQADRLKARDEVLSSVQRVLREKDVALPVPTQQVVVRHDPTPEPVPQPEH